MQDKIGRSCDWGSHDLGITSTLIEILVDSVNKDNGNICPSFATSVNKLKMTVSCFWSSKFNPCLTTRVVSR